MTFVNCCYYYIYFSSFSWTTTIDFCAECGSSSVCACLFRFLLVRIRYFVVRFGYYCQHLSNLFVFHLFIAFSSHQLHIYIHEQTCTHTAYKDTEAHIYWNDLRLQLLLLLLFLFYITRTYNIADQLLNAFIQFWCVSLYKPPTSKEVKTKHLARSKSVQSTW